LHIGLSCTWATGKKTGNKAVRKRRRRKREREREREKKKETNRDDRVQSGEKEKEQIITAIQQLRKPILSVQVNKCVRDNGDTGDVVDVRDAKWGEEATKSHAT
jgi:hypothetical protein